MRDRDQYLGRTKNAEKYRLGEKRATGTGALAPVLDDHRGNE